jgi:polyphosphate glucokinase
MKVKQVLGIDFGGSGIKGAPVDLQSGKMLTERFRITTPVPATPELVADAMIKIVKNFKWKGPVGVGFPAVVQQGVAKSAANIDKSWIGLNVVEYLSKATKLPVFVLNDADAAGLAEMKYGAGLNEKGTVLLLTIGTGVGTVLFVKRRLVPNLEWGHVYMPNGQEAELYTSDATRKKLELSWDDWGQRFNEYLVYMEQLINPDLIIIGGGVSKKMDKFQEFLTINCPLVPAQLMNDAGIVGAAVAAGKAVKSDNFLTAFAKKLGF